MWKDLLKKNIIICIILFFVIASNLFAGEKNKQQYPIDVFLEKCVESDFSTSGMTNCALKAIEMWDKEMNKTYKELMKKLPEKQRAFLKQSQIQWIKFRDAESDFTSKYYSGFEGTMWQNILVGEKVNIVKERALRLQIYLSYLEK